MIQEFFFHLASFQNAVLSYSTAKQLFTCIFRAKEDSLQGRQSLIPFKLNSRNVWISEVIARLGYFKIK